MTKRSRILGFGSAALLVIAGAVIAAAAGGSLGEVLGLVLMSLGFVLATSLVFYEVGLSEDHERDRAADGPKRTSRVPRLPRPRPRLERMRGKPRRLK
jgi:hypothetical protein